MSTNRQAEVHEMFMFAFHACGLRISDVISLRWKDVNFKENRISKVQMKTGNRNIVPLNKEALRILSK